MEAVAEDLLLLQRSAHLQASDGSHSNVRQFRSEDEMQQGLCEAPFALTL